MLLLELVQIGIGKKHKLSKTYTSKEWGELFCLAQRQGVTSIVLDGINKCFELGIALDMDFQTKMDWIGLVYQMETLYEQHKKSMQDLATLLKSSGFRMMVLKGYGLSLNYPIPFHRPVGDLDIWCFGEEVKVDSFLETKGIKIDRSHHHHTVFQYEQLTVENHFDFINIYTRRSSKNVESKLKDLAATSYTEDNGLYYPSANFNALFLLRHCAGHFATTEINIRQVLDWGFFLEKHHKEISWDKYLPYIKREGMYRFYYLLGLFCMRYLGFDASIFQGLYEDNLNERFCNEILNPEFTDSEDGTLLKSLVVKPRRWWHNRWKNKLCYPDSLFSTFVYGLWAKILKPSHFIH